MKWTKNERFPNDKVGAIKDKISDKVNGVSARFEGFVSDGSGSGKNKDLGRRAEEEIIGNQDLPKKIEMRDAGKANHSIPDTEPAILDKEIVSTSKSIGESIADQAKANTSTSEYTPLEIGSLKIERNSYYSHFFSLTPLLVTNRGCIRVSGKNFDYIQIIQRT
jgi:hypothetical protein